MAHPELRGEELRIKDMIEYSKGYMNLLDKIFKRMLVDCAHKDNRDECADCWLAFGSRRCMVDYYRSELKEILEKG